MENLDSTIIMTALPQMARSSGADPAGLNIGATAYTAPRGLTAMGQSCSDTAAATWLVCFCRGMAQPYERVVIFDRRGHLDRLRMNAALGGTSEQAIGGQREQ